MPDNTVPHALSPDRRLQRHDIRWTRWEKGRQEQAGFGIGPHVREGVLEILQATTPEQQLQEDQWRKTRAGTAGVERLLPRFNLRQRAIRKDHAQSTAVEIELELASIANERRPGQMPGECRRDVH